MRTLLNIVWLVFSGLWLALAYSFFALLLCLTIVLIPFGVQLFKLAIYALWPFGRVAVRSPGHNAGSTIGNVLWLIPGLVLVVGHLVTALFLALTIIGIPLALGNLKMIPLSLAPFGRDVVPSGDVQATLEVFRRG